jgi:hypothetical protein
MRGATRGTPLWGAPRVIKIFFDRLFNFGKNKRK